MNWRDNFREGARKGVVTHEPSPCGCAFSLTLNLKGISYAEIEWTLGGARD
jgi:hypothetical protein